MWIACCRSAPDDVVGDVGCVHALWIGEKLAVGQPSQAVHISLSNMIEGRCDSGGDGHDRRDRVVIRPGDQTTVWGVMVQYAELGVIVTAPHLAVGISRCRPQAGIEVVIK